MRQKHARGMISVTMILIVLMAFGAVGWLIYAQQCRLEKAQADLSTAKAEVEKANISIGTLETTNKGLQNTIASLKELTTIQQDELKKHQAEKVKVVTKIETIVKTLPKAKPKAEEPSISPDETVVVMQRASVLWAAYCVADSLSETCVQGAPS